MVPYLDIQFVEIPPVVYATLNSVVEARFNGHSVRVFPLFDLIETERNKARYANILNKTKLYSTCYHDDLAAKEFAKKCVPFSEALDQTVAWLKDKGLIGNKPLTEEDFFIVHIWW
jgi:hypothetical protein